MNLDEIFMQSYLRDYSEKEKKKIIHSQEDRAIASQKRKQIAIMEEFLQKFVDLDVTVNHRDQYTKNASGFDGLEPQKFKFYLVDSSKTWSPGISIFFDHPCEVEIAIPNKIEEEGVVVIRVASHHPDSYILEQKFNSFESACKALARFISKCTVKIGKDPRKYVKDVKDNLQHKKQTQDFTSNIPDEPPQNKKPSILKESESSLSLKKIGELFNLNKNKEQEDD
jgi:hypothetical protein